MVERSYKVYQDFADIYKTKEAPEHIGDDHPLSMWRRLTEEDKSEAQGKKEDSKKVEKFGAANQQTVYLTNETIQFDESERELTSQHSLPLMSWNSGLCFDIGEVANDNEAGRKALLEEVFGTHDKKQSFITAQLVDGEGETYDLDGSIKHEVLKRYSADDQKVNMIVCSCISCSAKGKEKPESIKSVKIKAVQPFQAHSVYWYSKRGKNFGDVEDPLARWRHLQEARVERKMKEREAQKEEK